MGQWDHLSDADLAQIAAGESFNASPRSAGVVRESDLPQAHPDVGIGEAMALGGAQGLTLNNADELAGLGAPIGDAIYRLRHQKEPGLERLPNAKALVRAAMGLPVEPNDAQAIERSYRGGRDYVRNREDMARFSHPDAMARAKTAGGLVGGLATSPLVPGAGLGLMGRAALSVPVGAAYGAVAGAGEAPEISDVPAAAAHGALVGGVGGPLAELIGSGLSSGAGALERKGYRTYTDAVGPFLKDRRVIERDFGGPEAFGKSVGESGMIPFGATRRDIEKNAAEKAGIYGPEIGAFKIAAEKANPAATPTIQDAMLAAKSNVVDRLAQKELTGPTQTKVLDFLRESNAIRGGKPPTYAELQGMKERARELANFESVNPSDAESAFRGVEGEIRGLENKGIGTALGPEKLSAYEAAKKNYKLAAAVQRYAKEKAIRGEGNAELPLGAQLGGVAGAAVKGVPGAAIGAAGMKAAKSVGPSVLAPLLLKGSTGMRGGAALARSLPFLGAEETTDLEKKALIDYLAGRQQQ